MQVQLKQLEIEAALKGFISQQGISLVGKTVTIVFTAGRKESGLSAELTIEDSDIPGFEAVDYHAPVLVPAIASKFPAITVVVAQPEVAPAAPVEEVVESPVVTEGEVAPTDPTTKTTSLFG